MAAAAADSVDNISSSTIAAARSSPYHGSQRRQPAKAAVNSPWSQVAKRESPPPTAAAPSFEVAAASSSSSVSSPSAGDEAVVPQSGRGGPNGSTGKRAPWNKASNGPVPEATAPVIAAESWPALSASPKRTSRKSTMESARVSSEGSSAETVSQGPENPSSSASSDGQLNSHTNARPNVNDPVPIRQRLTKRNNGHAFANGDAPQSPGPRNPSLDSLSSNSSPGEDSQRSGSVSENHRGNEHHQPLRNFYRNRTSGTYQRGDGSHSQNYGNRRDQDRSNQEWNSHRSFNHNREARMQQHRGYPRLGRGPHPAASAPVVPPVSGSFIASPQPRHFGGPPMNFAQMPPPLYYVPYQHPMNFASQMQPIVYLPQPDPILHTAIYNQINYYFSNDNLVKDTYLRRKMDHQGWVPVALIASFNKILELTDNHQLILDVARTSSLVEVQGDKLRRRDDWMQWIMPQVVQPPDVPGGQSTSDPVAAMAASVQTLSLHERAGNGDAGEVEVDAPFGTSTSASQ